MQTQQNLLQATQTQEQKPAKAEVKQEVSDYSNKKVRHEEIMEQFNNQPISTAARKLRLSKL